MVHCDTHLSFRLQYTSGRYTPQCRHPYTGLLGEKRGRHYGKQIASEPEGFWRELLQQLGRTPEEFEGHIGEMHSLRDEIIAHLDTEPTMFLPLLDRSIKSVIRLYDHLVISPKTSKFVRVAYPSGARHLH
jgi:hypothetical protein